jgi:hypothetical protein
MTARTLQDVMFLFTTAFVHKLERDARRHCGGDVRRRREFVTAVAICSNGFLRFPVTTEAR